MEHCNYYLSTLCKISVSFVVIIKKSMRLRLSIIVYIFSIVGLNAQNNADAEKVINNLIASIKTTAVKTNFQLSVTEKNGVNSQPVSGTFVLKANKFTLEMDETKVWFNGKTQWTYVKSDNEVTITEPSVDELAQINPMAILASFKAKSLIRFCKAKSTSSELIELIPKSKKDEFTKVEVQLNKKTKTLESIRLVDKKKSITILKLTNYKNIGNVTDDMFTFKKINYKNILINDLR
jgi:outer membrane lipoprotein-sorting protein